MGVPVTLQVYDLAHAPTIQNINKFTYGVTGAGGLFHTAIEIYGKEYSFGYVDRGTGVFACEPTKCNMHSYNHAVPLGEVELTPDQVRDIVGHLALAWPGNSYDLLKRNCCSFCKEFADILGVGERFPGWVIRFANIGAGALDAANSAAETARRVDAAYNISGTTAAVSAAVSGVASSIQQSVQDLDERHLGGRARETTVAGLGMFKRGLVEFRNTASVGLRGMCVDTPWLFGSGVGAAPKHR